MEIIERYIADDGKEFDDFDECKVYELELVFRGSTIKFYSDEFEPIILPPFYDKMAFDVEDAISKVEYITLNTEDDVEVAARLEEYFGDQFPSFCGNFMYNHYTDKWKMIGESDINRFKKIIELFGGE